MSDSIHQRLARLRVPVFAAPMFLISGPQLVISACKAGVVGAFPTPNARTPEILDEWLTEIGQALSAEQAPNGTSAPFAANLVVHSSNKRLPEDLDLVVKHQVPIVITALGGPARVVEPVQKYGGLVIADVNSVAFARKAADTGVDGLALVCSGAGGHTGAMNPFAFVEEVRTFWDGLIILAGGISTGAGILASQAAGADFAYMGTRFIATDESQADHQYKQMVVDCTSQDLLVTKAFTGANASMLIPSIANQGLDPATIAKEEAQIDFSRSDATKVKAWQGIWSAGQGVGCTAKIQSVATLVDDLDQQYARARQRIGFFPTG
ncbi:MAG: NAD(P)H-dependent flavin oxidoreductase [Lysobacterales bacterium]